MESSRVKVPAAESEVYLIGLPTSEIPGAKLPSKREMMKTVFYGTRIAKLPLRAALNVAVKDAYIFWEQAEIPVRTEQRSIVKLKSIHDEWRYLQKQKYRCGDVYKIRIKRFVDSLDELFDCASINALDVMSNEEAKKFLIAQRSKGRPGSIVNFDKNVRKPHKQKSAATKAQASESAAQDVKSEEADEISVSEDDTEDDPNYEAPKSVITSIAIASSTTRPSRKRIMNAQLAAVLDKHKISDRAAVQILSAAAEALGHDLRNLMVSRTSIRRSRQIYRAQRAKKIKDTINVLQPVDPVDQPPVLASSETKERILSVPLAPSAIANGNGEVIAEPASNEMIEWNLLDNYQGTYFDTTSSNIDHLQGAYTLLDL